MSNELEVRADTAIDVAQTDWLPEQKELLAAIGCAARTEGELRLFLHQCKRTGLDPFTRQIYMVNYGGSVVTQTGIDGFRVIARRAADASGGTYSLTATEWCGPDGVWREVWLSPEPPAAARVSVIRDGQMFPAIATYQEYVARKKDGTVNAMWQARPAGQLAKCAEALAYRRAFPQDLSGLYTDDEMGQADNPTRTARTTVTQTGQPQTASDYMAALHLTGDDFRAFTGRVLGVDVTSWKDLDETQRDRVLGAAAAWLNTGDDPTQTAQVDVLTGEIVPDATSDTDGEETPADSPAPATDDPRAPEPVDPDGPATQGQVGSIQAHMRRLGVDDREERLFWTGTLAGLEDPTALASSNELTSAQAATVLHKVGKLRDRAALDALGGDPS